jgi:nitrate/nitrite-specific signal transduction histidine kinase
MLRGVAYGNLYLTEKQNGEDFTIEDEELVALLAGQAAVAIENARLYEASNRWSRQLQSLNEVGNALATETDIDRLLDLIVRRLRELLDARIVALALPLGSDELRFAAVAGAEGLLGTTISRSGSKSGAVMERRRSERIDSVLDDPEVHQEISRQLSARTGMWVPLIGRSDVIGVLEIHDKEGPDARFTHDDFRLAETFATRAAVAVELSQRVARDAVRRVVQATLTNIVKHADAHNISVSLARRESTVAAVIEDDGSGFDQRAVREESVGLIGMRERLALLDGRLEIESRPGAGTTVVAEVPLS